MGFSAHEGQPAGATLQAPDPGPPSFSLLSVSQPLVQVPNSKTSLDGLPLDPVRLDHGRCVQVQTWPHCPPEGPDLNDPDTWKRTQAEDPGETFRPVGWYVPVGCDNYPATAATFAYWAKLAETDLKNGTAFAMEKFLWSAADVVATQGNATSPTLMSCATDITSGGSPVNPRDGVAMLEDAYATRNNGGGSATIHTPPVLVPYLLDHRTVTQNGSQLRGPLNELVSAGRGYESRVGPFHSGDDPTSSDVGTVWMVMSGPIFLRAGDVRDAANPASLANTFIEGHANPRTNEAQVILERRGVFLFDTCGVLAVPVAVPNVTGYTG